MPNSEVPNPQLLEENLRAMEVRLAAAEKEIARLQNAHVGPQELEIVVNKTCNLIAAAVVHVFDIAQRTARANRYTDGSVTKRQCEEDIHSRKVDFTQRIREFPSEFKRDCQRR